jgi:molybdopterin converting factor small subunit
MGIFDRLRGDQIKIHVLIRGRIGDDWKNIDEYVKVPTGTTLARFIEVADEAGLDLSNAIADSPHLRDTMMLNGERCPVAENRDRILADGDEIYLLAPLAGG